MAAERDQLRSVEKSNTPTIGKKSVFDKAEKPRTGKTYKHVKTTKSSAWRKRRTSQRVETQVTSKDRIMPMMARGNPLEFLDEKRGGRKASIGEVRDAAKVIRARKELNRVDEMRLIHQASEAKTSQEDIAVLLGTSQPTISRVTQQIVKNPSLLDRSPSEIINQRVVGQIDTETMMESLTSYAYSPAVYDPSGGDGFIRGDWHQVENALISGLITDQEYERIAREASPAKPERATR